MTEPSSFIAANELSLETILTTPVLRSLFA